MILLHADGTHETVSIRGTATQQAGHDVVLVDGVPFVVGSLSSGWCLDSRCDQCRYVGCGCSCHETALRLVAQTFDVGAQNARIAGRNDDTEAAQTTPVSSPLTDCAESRIDVNSTAKSPDVTTGNGVA